MRHYLKSIISLTVICAVTAILLAAVNGITAPIITEKEKEAANESLKVVMPNGEGFESVDIGQFALPETVTEAFKENGGGYVFKISTNGYSSGLVIMCGVDKDGKVTGSVCIASNETLGHENTFGKVFEGKDAAGVDAVDTISGATKTTLAYKNAVKDAINSFIIMGGGEVDIRSEEEILNDNLNSALPTGEGKFTSLFITEELIDVSAVYSADNKAGYVFVYKDVFVGTDISGNVVSDADDAVKTAVSAEAKKIINSSVTELDISGYANIPAQVQKAYKTASGNYVFDLRAAGFGITGDEWYNPSGEYIMIKVSATPTGKIIACETTSQKESDGIGSACADPKFYNQFIGKDETNYNDIDAISGATITTNAYKSAVSKVFEAIKILKGEA